MVETFIIQEIMIEGFIIQEIMMQTKKTKRKNKARKTRTNVETLIIDMQVRPSQ